MLASRLQRELAQLASSPPPGVAAWLSDGASLQRLTAQLDGPPGSAFEGGVFMLEVRVPDRYPIEPPQVRFITPVYHPNIDAGGRICLDILKSGAKGGWKPSLNVATVLQSIGLLLSEPNPDDGLMTDIAAEYKHSRGVFEEKARRWTQQHACGTVAAQAGAAGAGPAAAGEAAAEPEPVQKRALEDAAEGGAGPSDAQAAAEGGAGKEDAPAPAAAPPRKRLQLSRPAAAAPPPPPPPPAPEAE